MTNTFFKRKLAFKPKHYWQNINFDGKILRSQAKKLLKPTILGLPLQIQRSPYHLHYELLIYHSKLKETIFYYKTYNISILSYSLL